MKNFIPENFLTPSKFYEKDFEKTIIETIIKIRNFA